MDPVVLDGGQNNILLNAKNHLQIHGGLELIEITPYIEEMRRFAAMEHNKQTGENVELIGVVIAAVKEVALVKQYHLVVEAKNGRIRMIPTISLYYMVVVLDNPIGYSWTLQSCKPLHYVC